MAIDKWSFWRKNEGSGLLTVNDISHLLNVFSLSERLLNKYNPEKSESDDVDDFERCKKILFNFKNSYCYWIWSRHTLICHLETHRINLKNDVFLYSFTEYPDSQTIRIVCKREKARIKVIKICLCVNHWVYDYLYNSNHNLLESNFILPSKLSKIRHLNK